MIKISQLIITNISKFDTIWSLFTTSERFLSCDDFFEGLRNLNLDIKKSDVALLIARVGRGYLDENKLTVEEFRRIFYVEGIARKAPQAKVKEFISLF